MTSMPLLTILAVLCWSPLIAAEPVLRPGDLVAVCGDSITQGGAYPRFVEVYLRACLGGTAAAVRNSGWSGTGSDHFAAHLADTVLPLQPAVATVCFGMNDGGYAAADDGTERRYGESLAQSVRKLRAAGVRTVVLASPGVVDSRYFKNPKHAAVDAAAYNRTLARLGEVARRVAGEEGALFADVHTAMATGMAAAKQRYGQDYAVAGEMDGVHAGPPGHLAMAYAMLKALGCDGDLGTITVDAAAGTASAPAGHRVVSAKPGEVVVESSRYPFCFFSGRGDPPQEHVLPFEAHLNGTAAMLAAVPFNQDLNRFRLRVTGLGAANAAVTWGAQTRRYTAAELEAGINLAADFLDNPFVPAFLELYRAVRAKQDAENQWIKEFRGDRRPALARLLGADSAELLQLDRGYAAVHAALDRRCAVRPVTHTIRIEVLP
jgi:lysophospholipase L1-like esterase